MLMIQTVSQDQAEGSIRDGYAFFTDKNLDIPEPLRLMSASEGLFRLSMERIQYYANHSSLTFTLLTHIRYLAAFTLGYHPCRLFNENLLKKQGMEETQFRRMEADPQQAPLEEHECDLLCFVIKALKKPRDIGQADIDALHAVGWKDCDIIDALYSCASMRDHHWLTQVLDADPARQ